MGAGLVISGDRNTRLKAVGVLIGILTATTFVCLDNLLSIQQTQQVVEHTQQVLLFTEKTQRYLKVAEAEARSYLLAENKIALKNLSEATINSEKSIAKLEELTVDNPLQRSRVSAILNKMTFRLALLGKQIQSQSKVNSTKNPFPILGVGVAATEDIEMMFDIFKGEELRLLQIRKTASNLAVIRSIVTFIFVIGLIILLLTAALRFLSQEIDEHKATQQFVQDSERRFRSLVEFGKDVIFLLNTNREIIYASPSAERVLGFSQAEVLHADIGTLIRPDDVSTFSEHLQNILEHPETKPTFALRLKEGEKGSRWVEATLSNMLFFNSVKAIVLNFRDTTREKRDEFALKEAFSRSERQAKRLQQLNNASTRLNSAQSIDEVLASTVRIARELLGAHQVETSIATAGEQVYKSELSLEYREGGLASTPPNAEVLQSFFVDDFAIMLTQDELENDNDAFTRIIDAFHDQPPINGWMCAAISVAGEIIGYLSAKDKVDGEFSEDDKNILIQLTLLASTTLENLMLASSKS